MARLILLLAGALLLVALVGGEAAPAKVVDPITCDDEGNCAPPPPPPPPPAPPPPPPPPPNLNPPLAAGSSTVLPETNVFTFSASGGVTVRCKSQRHVQAYTQAGLYDTIKIETRFRVCYIPGVRIHSFNRNDPAMNPNPQAGVPYTAWGWESSGLDAGFPHVAVYTDRVQMKVQVSARFCLFPYGCGSSRHPWVSITFWRNNTMTVTNGVV